MSDRKLYRSTDDPDLLVEVVPDYEAMVYEAKEHLWRHLTVDEAKALWKAALQEDTK